MRQTKVMQSDPAYLMFCIPEKPSIENFNPEAKLPLRSPSRTPASSHDRFHRLSANRKHGACPKGDGAVGGHAEPAGFSSMVGEFIVSNLPKHCPSVVKNTYHNGHPDLLPVGRHPGNAAQHAGSDGIEVRASRYLKGWQGHNPEDAWLMVLVFESSRPSDALRGHKTICFRFLRVYGAQIEKADWQFAGRSQTSRRTITATVLPSGFEKMSRNWIYRAPGSIVKP